MGSRWRWWWLGEGRGVLELDERRTPPGLALELAVCVGRDGRSWLLVALSETGEVLAVVRGAEA